MPEELRSRWTNASYSPCRSLKKYSVPFGSPQIAIRLMISLVAALTVGYSLDSSFK